jgi:hypothetical protein
MAEPERREKFTVTGNGGNGIKVEAAPPTRRSPENKAFSNACLNGFPILGPTPDVEERRG